MQIGYIYRIWNKQSGKSYVGQSARCPIQMKRIKEHFNASDKMMYIDRAIKKHGKEAFDYEVLEVFDWLNDKDELMFMLNLNEKKYGLKYNCMFPKGYNLKIGNGRGIVSDAVKQKLSNSHTGKILTLTHRTNISKALKGNKHALNNTHTEETKQIISESSKGNTHNRGRTPWNKGVSVNKGVLKSEDTKEKMKLGAIKRWELNKKQNIAKICFVETFCEGFDIKITWEQLAKVVGLDVATIRRYRREEILYDET